MLLGYLGALLGISVLSFNDNADVYGVLLTFISKQKTFCMENPVKLNLSFYSPGSGLFNLPVVPDDRSHRVNAANKVNSAS